MEWPLFTEAEIFGAFCFHVLAITDLETSVVWSMVLIHAPYLISFPLIAYLLFSTPCPPAGQVIGRGPMSLT